MADNSGQAALVGFFGLLAQAATFFCPFRWLPRSSPEPQRERPAPRR